MLSSCSGRRRSQRKSGRPLPPAAWGLGEPRETVESGRASASASILRPLRDEAMAVADPLGRGIQSDPSRPAAVDAD